MSTNQIADTLAAHRTSADSWGWHCSCGVRAALSDLPVAEDVNPGKWGQADEQARRHVAEQILKAAISTTVVLGGGPDVRTSVMNREGVDRFLAAAEVGLEGTDEDDLDAVHAWQVLADLRG